MTSNQITILLADDHTIVRQGLARLLEDQESLKVVGEAKDGREAVERTQQFRPDVVIMDIAMPLLNGIEATRQIKKALPETKIIILSMHSHEHYISELFEAGVSGYLLKESSGRDIISAIHAAIEGKTFLSPSISKKVVDDYVSLRRRSKKEDLYKTLSNREREVFQLIAEGRSTKEIAELLCISISTVKTHRIRIMEKLQIDSLSKLIQFAVQLGFVEINR